MAEPGGGGAGAAGGGGPQQGSPAAGGVAAGGPARSAAESAGGPGSARTAGKKAQLRAAPRAKKLEKLGVYSACKVPGRGRPPAHGGWGLTGGREGGRQAVGKGRAGRGRRPGCRPALPAEVAALAVPADPASPGAFRPAVAKINLEQPRRGDRGGSAAFLLLEPGGRGGARPRRRPSFRGRRRAGRLLVPPVSAGLAALPQ